MHELRRGEMARNGEIPHVPYYGTIDATPLWLVLLHETWRWTGDEPLVRDLLPHAERALNWIHQYGDLDGDGLIEYTGSASGKGLANQGWKDSGDGVPFPDGSLPEPPIALVEVQGYVHDALARSADLFAAFGNHERAESLRKRAADLREQIIRHFWMEELNDNALIVLGMARYGFSQLALPVVRGLQDAAATDEFQRVPELFCGMTRTPGIHPVAYPVSCSPQAWASASFFMMLQAVLGIHPDAPARLLRIRNPVLPSFLEELTLSGLAIGKSRVSLQFRKYRDRTFANLLSVSGDPLQVTIELA